MATTVPDPIEGEHPRLKITAPINDGRLLMDDIKCKGGAKCLFLHPGEKARRDPRRFSYSSRPCIRFLFGGSCPKGDDCPSAHGLLEFLHPSLESELEDLMEFEDADAVERVAINLILDLERNGQILGYEYTRQAPDDMIFEKGFHKVGMSYLPGMTKMGLAASKLDPSFYDGTSKCQHLAAARAASNGIFSHDQYGDIYARGDAFTLRNDRPVIVSSGGGSHGRLQGLSSFYSGSDKKLFLTDVVAATAAAKRVGLTAPLLCSAASPTAGWIDEPELVAFLDSAASVHVVGEDTELQGYQPLAEPRSIAVADGYSLDVLGVGYIETPGGSFSVPNVFKVRGLELNLISVSQLDRDHGLFSGFHDGTCKVLKRDGDLIGGGFLQANNLYALRFLQVPAN